jgi:hypothetical protein
MSVYINFDDDFNDVNNSLKAAREEFLAASGSYDGDGKRFENIAIAQLERLLDPENNHAAPVREGAITAIAAIRSFGSTHAELAAQVAVLLLSLQQKVLSTTIQMAPVGVFELPAGSSLSIQETIHNYVKNLDTKQRENVALVTGAILLGHQVAEAVRAATKPIAMRQGTLEQAVRELAPDQLGTLGGTGKVIEAGGKAVAEELKMTVLEEILKQATIELGTHIPIAGIVVSIARVASDVRARQAALKERYELQLHIRDAHYQRGPIDVMFDLPAQLQDEDRITAGVLVLISQLFAALQ